MTDYIVVERNLRIMAPVTEIQGWVTDFHKWVDWSPWEGIDPDLQRSYEGPTEGVGARYEWSGNRKAGAGHMRIEAIREDEIDIDLTFTKPFKSDSKTQFRFSADGDQTDVSWSVLTPRTLLLRVMSVFMKLDKTVGPDLESGLARLKAVSEAKA
jgi:hypothetical protein